MSQSFRDPTWHIPQVNAGCGGKDWTFNWQFRENIRTAMNSDEITFGIDQCVKMELEY